MIRLGCQPAEGRRGVRLRPAGAADRMGLVSMFERCSLETRYGRFQSPVRAFPGSHLDALTGGRPDVDAWVATLGEGSAERVLGLGSLHQQGPDRAELGLLVEDAWQRRGVGTSMLGCLRDRARYRGIGRLNAVVLTDNTHVLGMLRTVFGAIRMERQSFATAVTVVLGDTGRHGSAPLNATGRGRRTREVGQTAVANTMTSST